MKDIKIKDVGSKTIKTIDKSVVGLQKTKDNVVNIKNSLDTITTKDETVVQKVADDISMYSNSAVNKSINLSNKAGKSAFNETKKNLIKLKTSKMKNVTKAGKKTIKGGKTAIKSANKVVKATKNTAKNSARAVRMTRLAVQKTIAATKVTVKALASLIKLSIASTKALISLLIAGGWVVLLIIIVVCMIGLICSSIFGIFFSGESSNNGVSVNTVVANINNDLANRISTIQTQNQHDDYVINVDRAEWKEVLALYSAKVTGGTGASDVMTMDTNKQLILTNLFWSMHTITSEVKTESVQEEKIDDYGTSSFQYTTKKILYINITSKTVDEIMAIQYFTPAQKMEVNELLKEEYDSLWASAIYGTSIGSPDIVQIALSQLGNVGGQPYWSWYGFDYRVEWCATFVSWVANEAGYIESKIIPKFAGVNQGVDWFVMLGQFKEAGSVPNEGSIIFFDWDQDNDPDHVGIVEKVENNIVYTVEGNSSNAVKQVQYNINSKDIYGYGFPAY